MYHADAKTKQLCLTQVCIYEHHILPNGIWPLVRIRRWKKNTMNIYTTNVLQFIPSIKCVNVICYISKNIRLLRIRKHHLSHQFDLFPFWLCSVPKLRKATIVKIKKGMQESYRTCFGSSQQTSERKLTPACTHRFLINLPPRIQYLKAKHAEVKWGNEVFNLLYINVKHNSKKYTI